MNIYQLNRKFYSRPIRLTEEQTKNPGEVIQTFFSQLELYDIREDLSKLSECAMITDSEHFMEPEQRASIINFLEMLEECIEAVYLLNEIKKSELLQAAGY